MATRTLALVGAAGGVGTTRLTAECGATLARAGRDVVVFDAAWATQGLASYLDRVGRDVTDLVTGEATLEETLYDAPVDVPGRLALCPARASFESLARAKTPAAADRFRDQIAAASLAHDVVLVDVPPVASNEALAAVETVGDVAVVTVDTERGARALDRQVTRLETLGTTPDASICTHADAGIVVADATIPMADNQNGDAPFLTVAGPDDEFTRAVVEATETVLNDSLDIECDRPGVLRRLLGPYLSTPTVSRQRSGVPD